MLDKEGEEIDLKQNFDEDDNMGLAPAESPAFEESSVEVSSELDDGFAIEHPEDEDPEEFSEEDMEAVERSMAMDDEDDGFGLDL